MWEQTAIFITWDEWGGFYDSVMPPAVDEVGLGFRVPLLDDLAVHAARTDRRRARRVLDARSDSSPTTGGSTPSRPGSRNTHNFEHVFDFRRSAAAARDRDRSSQDVRRSVRLSRMTTPAGRKAPTRSTNPSSSPSQTEVRASRRPRSATTRELPRRSGTGRRRRKNTATEIVVAGERADRVLGLPRATASRTPPSHATMRRSMSDAAVAAAYRRAPRPAAPAHVLGVRLRVLGTRRADATSWRSSGITSSVRSALAEQPTAGAGSRAASTRHAAVGGGDQRIDVHRVEVLAEVGGHDGEPATTRTRDRVRRRGARPPRTP